MKRTMPSGSAAALLLIAGLAWGADAPGAAQPIQKTTLEQHALTGSPTLQVVTGTTTYAPGVTSPLHYHDGDETGYVLEGSIVLQQEGQPDRTLNAGQSFYNTRGLHHHVTAGSHGAKLLSTWIVDKDKPLATPVK